VRILRFVVVALCIFSLGLGAVEVKKLTFQQAMVAYGRGLLKPLPRVTSWLDNETWLEMRGMKVLAVNARNGSSRVFFDAKDHPELTKQGLSLMAAVDFSKDHDSACFLDEDKLVVYRFSSGKMLFPEVGKGVLTPRLSPDGRKVAYTRENDLYVHDLESGETRRLTKDGSDVILNGYASWVYYEEILGRRSQYCAFWWGPRSRRVAFLRFDQSKVPVFNMTRSEGVYPELERQYYPKAGAPNPEARLAVADLDSGNIHWLKVPGDGDHYVAHPRWSSDGSHLYFQWLNRGQDHLKVYHWGGPNSEVAEVYSQKRSTWVDFLEDDDLALLERGGLIIRAARGDWHHLFRVSTNGRVQPLTRGEWGVGSILQVNEKRGEVLFTASREDSTQSRAYRVSLKGSGLRCLTPQPGWHTVTPSPDGRWLLDRHSALDRPARLDLRDHRGRLVRNLGDSATPAVTEYKLDRVKLMRAPAGDGVMLPLLMVTPPEFDPEKKYPVILQVYGGPGAMSVRNGFPGYRWIPAFYLSQMGVVVVAADHRGAGHHGQAGMDQMHRKLGHWEIHDYSKVVEFLKTKSWIDGKRIGISGGSYGGYVSALALARAPEVFQFGIASFSVTDWKLYDSVYTERYMDTPDENPEGYKTGSVLEHVKTYRGGLRLVHGTMDDNVHIQNSLQLLDLLQDAGKPVEFMAFPGERHGFRGLKRGFDSRCSLDFWSRMFFGRAWSETP